MINGERIISFDVVGENQGHLNTFKTLKECYEYIKQLKKDDRRFHYSDETYYIDCNTEKSVYCGYTLRKYKNKFYLK